MCRKTQKSPAFQAGDELFLGYFAWFSSIGSHMGQERNAAGCLVCLIRHSKRLLLRNRTEIIAYKSVFANNGKCHFPWQKP